MIEPTERRRLGQTGLELSLLGVGGGSALIAAGEAAESVLEAAWNAGLRTFDTAPFYGVGVSERRVGRYLGRKPRDTFVLSSKVGRLIRDGKIVHDYTGDGVLSSIEESLERLGLGSIDIAYIHDVNPHTHGADYENRFREAMDGGYQALHRLREEGRLKAIGVGVKDWEVCLRFARAGDFDCFMLAGGYTLLDHGSLQEFLPYCRRRDIRVVVASPLNSGILATGATEAARYYYAAPPPEILERTRALAGICAGHDVPLAAAALQFPLYHPAVAGIVAGYRAPAELDEALAHLRRPIPAALWAELKGRGLIPAGAPTP